MAVVSKLRDFTGQKDFLLGLDPLLLTTLDPSRIRVK